MRHEKCKSLKVGMVILDPIRGECTVVEVRKYRLQPTDPGRHPPSQSLIRYDVRLARPDGTTFTEVGCRYSDSFTVIE